MKIVDRYTSLSLIKPFLLCLAATFSLWIVYDLFDNFGDFISNKPDLWLVLRYYLAKLPPVAQFFAPIAFFTASLFVLSTFSNRRELVALQAAGISLTRISIPFFLLALGLGFAQSALYHTLTPEARKTSEALRRSFQGGDKEPADTYRSVIFRNPTTGVMWYLQEIDVQAGVFKQGEILLPDALGRDREKWFVAQGNYEANGGWNFARVRKVAYRHDGSRPPPPEDVAYVDPDFLDETPAQLVAAMRQPQELPWPELKAFVHQPQPPSAVRMAPFRTEYYYRMAYPWMSLVLCLYAFALGITNDRQNRAAALFGSLLVISGMLLWMWFTEALGKGNRIPALVAGWNGTILFGSAGLVLFARRVGWVWTLADWLRQRLLRPAAGSG